MASKVYVDRSSDLWSHTKMRIRNAEDEATVSGIFNPEKFQTLMLKRLKLIRNEEKIHYAIVALKETGHADIAEIYDSMLVINVLRR